MGMKQTLCNAVLHYEILVIPIYQNFVEQISAFLLLQEFV